MDQITESSDIFQANRVARLISWLLGFLLQISATLGIGDRLHTIIPLPHHDLLADTERYSMYHQSYFRDTAFYLLLVDRPVDDVPLKTDWDNISIAPWEPTELLIQGAKFNNQCRAITAIAQALLRRLLANDAYVKTVEWAYCRPKPRWVFFLRANGEKSARETAYQHDVILLTAHNGRRYVVDFTGAQFGFSQWFFTYEEYERDCVFVDVIGIGAVEVRPRDFQMERLRHNADFGPDWHRNYSRNVLDTRRRAIFAFDCVLKLKRREYGLPTMTFQQLSDEEKESCQAKILELFKAPMTEVFGGP